MFSTSRKDKKTELQNKDKILDQLTLQNAKQTDLDKRLANPNIKETEQAGRFGDITKRQVFDEFDEDIYVGNRHDKGALKRKVLLNELQEIQPSSLNSRQMNFMEITKHLQLEFQRKKITGEEYDKIYAYIKLNNNNQFIYSPEAVLINIGNGCHRYFQNRRKTNDNKMVSYIINSFQNFSDKIEACGDLERDEHINNYFSCRQQKECQVENIKKLCKIAPQDFSKIFNEEDKKKISRVVFLLNDVLEWGSPMVTGDIRFGVARTLANTVNADFFKIGKKKYRIYAINRTLNQGRMMLQGVTIEKTPKEDQVRYIEHIKDEDKRKKNLAQQGTIEVYFKKEKINKKKGEPFFFNLSAHCQPWSRTEYKGNNHVYTETCMQLPYETNDILRLHSDQDFIIKDYFKHENPFTSYNSKTMITSIVIIVLGVVDLYRHKQ